MAKLSPVFNDQTIKVNGDPYVGAKLFAYVAGSSTKQAVYTDAAGTVPHSNPIILDSLGFPTQGPIWIPEGISVKFVLAPPNDTDPPTSPIKTIDSVQGVNDASVSISEWQASGVAPTYISANSFSVQGDQTTEFQKGRRAQFTTGLGTVYGKIINSVFAASITTITMLMDGTSVLYDGLSVVNLSLLRANPTALPNPIELLRSSVVGHATLTPTWDYAYGEIQDVTGVITYTAIPNAPRPGATRIWYPAAGAIMTNGGNISVQGGANVTAESGDKWIITATSTTTFDVGVVKESGKAIVSTAEIQPFTAVANTPANGVTLSLGATALDFRSTTLSSGTIETVVVAAPINTVISSGSTGGAVNGAKTRFAALAMNVAGVAEIAWCNASGGVDLDESKLITTVAEGGAGAADSSAVIYSTTARVGVPFRIVGYWDETQAVAGTHSAALNAVQGAGGQIRVIGANMVRLNTSNGYGSTNTKYLRFLNVVSNFGGDITYADSATLGATFTINAPGVYAVSYCFNSGASGNLGLALNDNQGTTNISATTLANILAIVTNNNGTGNLGGQATWAGYLPAGSVIVAKNEGQAASSPALVSITVTKTG